MSRQTLFEEHSEAALNLIRDGASIPDAARELEIGEPTIKGWLSRGRKDPRSKYGGFAASVGQAFTERQLPSNDDRPADRDELLLLASRAARAGNVQAMRLLAELLAGDEGDDRDELSEFDELAKRRRSR
jgi:hypothetical protein